MKVVVGEGWGAFLEERMCVCKCEFMFMTMTICLGMVVYESECVPVYMGLLMCEFMHTPTVSVEEESLKAKESVLGSTHATTECACLDRPISPPAPPTLGYPETPVVSHSNMSCLMGRGH